SGRLGGQGPLAAEELARRSQAWFQAAESLLWQDGLARLYEAWRAGEADRIMPSGARCACGGRRGARIGGGWRPNSSPRGWAGPVLLPAVSAGRAPASPRRRRQGTITDSRALTTGRW